MIYKLFKYILNFVLKCIFWFLAFLNNLECCMHLYLNEMWSLAQLKGPSATANIPGRELFKINVRGERSGSAVECLTRDRGAADSSLTGVTVLCPSARHIDPCWTRPFIIERLLMGRKESNQTNKQTNKCIWNEPCADPENSVGRGILTFFAVFLNHQSIS